MCEDINKTQRKVLIMSNQNLVNVDFAAQDIRSVSAMLRGYGDGRENAFNKFMTEEALKDPLVTEEQLQEVYRIQAKAELHRNIRQIQNAVSSTWISIKPKRQFFSFFKFRSN